MFKIIHTKSIATTLVVAMLFFSCKNNFNEVQQVGVLQNQPASEAQIIDLKYTEVEEDSVRLLANLLSDKMLDYSNRDFPFQEFPKGIELRVYDKEGKKTTILSDYAIVYADTDLIDLQGNVRIATHQKDTLFTSQLYYNQKLEWLFTNQSFEFKRSIGPLYGNVFDADMEFKDYQILEMGGNFQIDN